MSRSLRSLLLGAGLSLLLTGCGDDEITLPTRVGVTYHSVSGVITEVTAQGVRPSAGAWVYPFVRGATGTTADEGVRTDAQGRYLISRVARTTRLQLRISKPGYFQQCAQPEVTIGSDLSVLDAQLVAGEVLSVSPSSLPVQRLGYRFVSGTVYDFGHKPVAGALVGYGDYDAYAATTRSDAQGRYLLCGIPEGEQAWITAEGVNVGVDKMVPAGPSAAGVDLVFWR